jgi:ribonucleoside-diphosphate reductase alpha chain
LEESVYNITLNKLKTEKQYMSIKAFEKSKKYFNGDELAANVFLDKYRNGDEQTPKEMHQRLSKEFANELYKKLENKTIGFENLSEHGRVFFKHISNLNGEELKEYIFTYFDKFKYIVPQGRVMAGLGVYDAYRSLSNCLRLPPPKDSYSSIMYSDTCLVSVAKRGCGYGLGISGLRPSETPVSNAAQTSTGAVSFMHRYSFSTREVAQNGRRGACLIDIQVEHPDVKDFITIKSDLTKVTGANISVKYTDVFMQEVVKGGDFIHKYPIDLDIKDINLKDLEYDKLITVADNKFVKKSKAKDIFDLTVKQARDNAEPGVFFWDRMLDYDPACVYDKYRVDGTNACGEQPMAIGDTCRLILENLFSFVKNPFEENSELDYDKLYEVSYMQLILGDILVDLEIKYIDRIIEKIKSDDIPTNEKQIELDFWELVKDMAKSGRRVGCGLTGLGDMLAALNFKYDSEEALKITEKVMRIKMEAELEASIDLSVLFGSFKGFDVEKEFPNGVGGNGFFDMIIKEFPEQVERMKKFGRRNVNWSTIAPAGSVSIETQTTSGCEALFMPYFTRNVKINPNEKHKRVDFVDDNGDSWMKYPVIHPKIKDRMIELNLDITNEDEVKKYYESSPYYKSTANDIHWLKRVEMQAILQKYTTSAISTTLNLPEDVTEETVYNIYIKSWELGLKGQTIYRDNCRSGVLVKNDKKEEISLHTDQAPKRPKELEADIHIATAKGEKYVVAVGMLDDQPYEVFGGKANGFGIKQTCKGKLIKHKKGQYGIEIDNKLEIDDFSKHFTPQEQTIFRMASTMMRHGIPIEFVVEQMQKSTDDMFSLPSAVARVLKKYIKDGQKVTGQTCPECGSENLVYQGGCVTCLDCGWSKCS